MSVQFELQMGSETWFSGAAAAAAVQLVCSGFFYWLLRRNSGPAERYGLRVTQLLYHRNLLAGRVWPLWLYIKR